MVSGLSTVTYCQQTHFPLTRHILNKMKSFNSYEFTETKTIK